MKVINLYRLTNKTIGKSYGKVYIGQSQNYKERWANHKTTALGSNEEKKFYIHYALAKYGIDNFDFELIASCKVKEDANELEGILMRQYQSTNPKFGYNLKGVANCVEPSEATIQKMIISQKISRKKIQEKRLQSGDLKCNAPGCEVNGLVHYRFYKNIRYCQIHFNRLSKNGTLESFAGKHRIGTEPPNKHKFSEEIIQQIVDDPRSTNILAKEFKVSHKVIDRIRKEHSINVEKYKDDKYYFTYEQVQEIIYDISSVSSIARKFNVSCKVIDRILLENPTNIYRGIKKQLSKDEISYILNSSKGVAAVGKELGYSGTLVARIRKENGDTHYRGNEYSWSEDQMKIIMDPSKMSNEVAKEFNVTSKVINRLRKNSGFEFKSKKSNLQMTKFKIF